MSNRELGEKLSFSSDLSNNQQKALEYQNFDILPLEFDIVLTRQPRWVGSSWQLSPRILGPPLTFFFPRTKTIAGSLPRMPYHCETQLLRKFEGHPFSVASPRIFSLDYCHEHSRRADTRRKGWAIRSSNGYLFSS